MRKIKYWIGLEIYLNLSNYHLAELTLILFVVFMLSFIFHVSTFTLRLCQVKDRIHEPMNKSGKALLMCRIKLRILSVRGAFGK